MARIEQLPKVQVEATLIISEEELAALEALSSYGTDTFLYWFYKTLGKHYLSPHENGLRSLFDAVRGKAPTILKRAQNARAAFTDTAS